MTAGQRYTAWAQLRAWVTWLYDRYELLIEDKLPQCWAEHPGLVEELWALRAWRIETFNGQPGGGQAACYWHQTMHTVLQAAKTMYAPGCRAGHRAAPRPVAADKKVQRRWARARPDAGVPPADIAAGEARHNDGWVSPEQIAAAYDTGEAADVLGVDGHLMYQGGWWAPAGAGWYETSGPLLPGQQPAEDPWRELDEQQPDGDPPAEGSDPWTP